LACPVIIVDPGKGEWPDGGEGGIDIEQVINESDGGIVQDTSPIDKDIREESQRDESSVPEAKPELPPDQVKVRGNWIVVLEGANNAVPRQIRVWSLLADSESRVDITPTILLRDSEAIFVSLGADTYASKGWETRRYVNFGWQGPLDQLLIAGYQAQKNQTEVVILKPNGGTLRSVLLQGRWAQLRLSPDGDTLWGETVSEHSVRIIWKNGVQKRLSSEQVSKVVFSDNGLMVAYSWYDKKELVTRISMQILSDGSEKIMPILIDPLDKMKKYVDPLRLTLWGILAQDGISAAKIYLWHGSFQETWHSTNPERKDNMFENYIGDISEREIAYHLRYQDEPPKVFRYNMETRQSKEIAIPHDQKQFALIATPIGLYYQSYNYDHKQKQPLYFISLDGKERLLAEDLPQSEPGYIPLLLKTSRDGRVVLISAMWIMGRMPMLPGKMYVYNHQGQELYQGDNWETTIKLSQDGQLLIYLADEPERFRKLNRVILPSKHLRSELFSERIAFYSLGQYAQ
jgi:hypothetical protein